MPLSQIPPNMIGNSQILQYQSMNIGATIVENTQTITQSYCITTGSSAMSAGPVTIALGNVVTVPPGSTWSIV
jgi:hypothetical protein